MTNIGNEMKRLTNGMDAADGKRDCVIHKDFALLFLGEERGRMVARFMENEKNPDFTSGKPLWNTFIVESTAIRKLEHQYESKGTPAVQRLPNCVVPSGQRNP